MARRGAAAGRRHQQPLDLDGVPCALAVGVAARLDGLLGHAQRQAALEAARAALVALGASDAAGLVPGAEVVGGPLERTLEEAFARLTAIDSVVKSGCPRSTDPARWQHGDGRLVPSDFPATHTSGAHAAWAVLLILHRFVVFFLVRRHAH